MYNNIFLSFFVATDVINAFLFASKVLTWLGFVELCSVFKTGCLYICPVWRVGQGQMQLDVYCYAKSVLLVTNRDIG